MQRNQVMEQTSAELARRTRQVQAWWLPIAMLVVAVAFGVLALFARTIWYFPIDLELTRAIQGVQSPGLDRLLDTIAWVGFSPQSNVIFGSVIVGLFLLGLRLEAGMTFFAAAGSAGLWYLLNPLVGRPRPSPELVDVAMQIPAGSFPSGHVLNLTAIFGFLIYLVLILVRNRRVVWGLVVLLALPIVTVGFARIEDGAHWPSDVLGGYMAGVLWLALTIQLYRWAKQRFAGSHGHSAGETPASRRGTVGVGITDRRMH